MARGGRGGGGGRSHGGRSHGIGGRSHGIGAGRSYGIGHHHHGIGHRSYGLFGRNRSHGWNHNRSHYQGLGYRHYGFGSHHRFHHHYNRHYGAGFGLGGGGLARTSYFNTYDTIAANPVPPRIENGTYFFAGNQQAAVANFNTFPTFYQQKVMEAQGQQVPMNEASFFIVGNKTHQGNDCCYMLTIMFAVCLIFPFFFMCCDWWKKIVNQLYEVNIETYRSLANFLQNAPSITKVTLEVVDNAFNAEKAQVLHQALMGRGLTEFNFINTAEAIDYN
jgi:hypothetical protein